MTEDSNPPAWRVHYALGSNGMVMAFITPDLIPGDPPTLRPDHPLAQVGVTWDFEPFYETERPARLVEVEEADEFTDEQIDAAINAIGDWTPDPEIRQQMRRAFRAAGARPS